MTWFKQPHYRLSLKEKKLVQTIIQQIPANTWAKNGKKPLRKYLLDKFK